MNEPMTETKALAACCEALETTEDGAAARVVAYLQIRFGGAPIPEPKVSKRPEHDHIMEFCDELKRHSKVVDCTTAGQLLLKNKRLWDLVQKMLPHMPADVKEAIQIDFSFTHWEDFVRDNEYEIKAAESEVAACKARHEYAFKESVP